jgi:hypothetical protein
MGDIAGILMALAVGAACTGLLAWWLAKGGRKHG